MKFEDFAVGQTFAASFTISKADFDSYISFARTRNILHENSELAEKEGIKGIMLPGRRRAGHKDRTAKRLHMESGRRRKVENHAHNDSQPQL